MQSIIEIWKDIPGYEGLYEASNTGKVKSIANTKIHGFKPNKETILAGCINTRGYLCVNLYKNRIRKTIRIHKLVAETFIPNPKGKCCVNHINGNRLDNRLENLEWVTWSENTLHAHRTGLATHVPGVEASKKKTVDIASNKVYASVSEAAAAKGMKVSTLSKMLTGVNRNKTTLQYL